MIVSCGTSGTPLLLYRSGYGPKDLLGQKLIVENDNVGRHLDGDLLGSSLDLIALFGEDIHVDEGSGSELLVHEDGDRNKLTLRGISRISYGNRYPDLLALFPTGACPAGPDLMKHIEGLRKRIIHFDGPSYSPDRRGVTRQLPPSVQPQGPILTKRWPEQV